MSRAIILVEPQTTKMLHCAICKTILYILAFPTVLWATIYIRKLSSHLLPYCDVFLTLFPLLLVSNAYMQYMGPVDLKKKYKAKWALVTGAGTGIGKSLAEAMAAQGLNVVLVSLPDKFLDETTEELRKAYPQLEFRAIPAKFDHKTDYMPAIIEVRAPLPLRLCPPLPVPCACACPVRLIPLAGHQGHRRDGHLQQCRLHRDGLLRPGFVGFSAS